MQLHKKVLKAHLLTSSESDPCEEESVLMLESELKLVSIKGWAGLKIDDLKSPSVLDGLMSEKTSND